VTALAYLNGVNNALDLVLDLASLLDQGPRSKFDDVSKHMPGL
jgi:hypothetical protein